MSVDRNARLSELIAQARHLGPVERTAFLREACGDDATLLAELDSVLTADSSDGPPASRLANRPRVGPYELRQRLGEGGAGSVYLAVRSDAPEVQVAVKFIKRGLDSAELVRRFHLEREILADLNHPHIVRLLDGGTTDDGVPYIVMEYVAGRPLDRYCDEQALGLRERLMLFLQVCDAVQYAHRRAILHRDLQPGNVLVDDRGRPRVLDFGVYRVRIGSDLHSTQFTTQVGRVVENLPFFSPEQIEGAPDHLDVRSDLYALGGIAYHLLARRPPFDLKNLSFAEAIRVRQETEARPLSRVLPSCPADLDAVIGKAIQRDPDQRYQSVFELSNDLQRFLDGKRVLARPAPTWQHPAVVAVASATATALVLLLLAILFGGFPRIP
jgi:serine/threonine protein kinase